MHRFTLLVLAAALGLAPLAGCALSEADEVSSATGELGSGSPTQPAAPTVVDLAVSSPELSTLVEAVLKAELAGALAEAGPFTVFAPTNGAFAAFGIDPADVDVETLTAVLLNHVVPGRFSARDLRRKARQGAHLTTLGGLVLRFDRRPLTVNEIPVRFANRRAGNGIVHVVDGVLLEGGTTLVDQVRLRAELSTLLAAVAKAGLADTLAGDGPFTVFRPERRGVCRVWDRSRGSRRRDADRGATRPRRCGPLFSSRTAKLGVATGKLDHAGWPRASVSDLRTRRKWSAYSE